MTEETSAPQIKRSSKLLAGMFAAAVWVAIIGAVCFLIFRDDPTAKESVGKYLQPVTKQTGFQRW